MINSIPKPLKTNIETSLSSLLGKETYLMNFNFSSGGCINKTGLLETNVGEYFLKWNQKSLYFEMFIKEKIALEKLISTEHNLTIPKPILTGNNEDYIFLILENIVSADRNQNYWQNMGKNLAKLHRNSHRSFGLDHDNYIGSIKQINSEHENWLEFFQINRIEPTFEMAFNSGFFSNSDRVSLESTLKYLEEFCPGDIKPSLLHGDLWSGNLIVDNEGNPCLIDPAIYYGFREVEIAFTELFGRFYEDFYIAYNQEWPLAEGYEDRKDIWNLYPLLVHVNIFGGAYTNSVKSILNRYK